MKVVKQGLQLQDNQLQYNDFQVTSFPIKLPILCREGTMARRVSLFEHIQVLFPYWYRINVLYFLPTCITMCIGEQ